MKNKLIPLFLVPLLVSSLSGCKQSDTNKTSDNESENTQSEIIKNYAFTNDMLLALQKGFKVTGTNTTTTRYFQDSEYVVPFDKKASLSTTHQISQTYTNTKDYTGVDYKIYQVNDDKTLKYVISDNMYDNNGHLFFNSVDYDNTLIPDFYASDDNGNQMPYGSNASLNPFTLLRFEDFIKVEDKQNTYTLNNVKSELVFTNLAYYLKDVQINTNIESIYFTVKENGISNIDIVSKDYHSMTTIDLVNVYTIDNHVMNLLVSEIGTADAKTEIKVEPEKPENSELGVALTNFANLDSYRVNRHYKTNLDEREETIDIYFDNRAKAIYMAVYYLNLGPRPAMSTDADALFVDSKKADDEDERLNAYMYLPLPNDPSRFAFQRAQELASIDNLLDYESFLLPVHGISQNVFNKNSDGSYSPIDSIMAFMAGDCFVPFLCSTNEIAGGFVEDFKLYLNKDKTMIDHIVLQTKLNNMTAEITITYDLANECVIPFNALNKIYE